MDSERILIDPPFVGVLRKTGERGKIIAYLPKHPPAFIFVSADGKEIEIAEEFDIDEVQTFAEEKGRKTLLPNIKRKIRKRLQEEKRKIEKEIEEEEGNLKKYFRESASQRISSHHTGESNVDSSAAIIEQRIENRKKRIRKINQAFLRLDVLGNYGICSCGCGRKIPLSRLEKIPFASLRADCKEKLEEKNSNNPAQRRPKRRR